MRKSARNIFLIPRAVRFVRSHAMFVVAALVACVTMVIVPPDSAYLGYFDWNTLGCLFSVLVVAVIFISLLAMDRTALKAVDYSLLLAFVCFFIFAGNMARMPYLGELLKSLMDANGLIAPALLNQVISNVPAAVLLSHFTESWQALLVGVNIGGAGTLIASLASLITLRFFSGARKIFPDLAKDPATKDPALSLGRFMKLFTCLNAGFLVALLVVCHLSGV